MQRVHEAEDSCTGTGCLSMFDVGRLCVKIAGRDAGKKCVIVDDVDGYTVLVDGETRRRKVNVMHLEPLAQTVSLGKGASREDVKVVFGEMGVKLVDTQRKEKKARPRRVRKVKVKAPVEEKKTAKKEAKQKKVVKEEKKDTAESA